jgi:salicylate hydroxylase
MSDVPAKYNAKERPEMDPQWSKPPFSVALVGGGITGVTLAIALLKRGIDVKIYEQARAFTEIGAGIAFSPNAKQAMGKCDPAICEAYERIATRSGSEKKKYTWYDWVDGYNQPDGAPPTPLFTIERDSTADGCHRAHLLKELLKLVPEGVAEFNKRLERIDEPDINGPLTLKFFDGTDRAADLGKFLSALSRSLPSLINLQLLAVMVSSHMFADCL